MLQHAQNINEALLSLFFPRLCLACNQKAPAIKELICTECLIRLPRTIFHLEKENEFTQRFWGRTKLETGAAMYLFSKGSKTQNLIHNLKYNGKAKVGVLLGQIYGRKLAKSPLYQSIDVIVPVPLHWKKLQIRGYNQSEQFARGLSETMNIPYLKDGMIRTMHADSQTTKSREERMANVLKSFDVYLHGDLKGKHILLADDVLTTGATIEACTNKLLKLENTKVSAVTIAMAEY